MRYDIGVIGGGVIGLACAWRLAQGGARVGVWERGRVGREASWAAAGMLAAQCEAAQHPLDGAGTSGRSAMLDWCLQSRTLYPAFAEELRDLSGIDIELSLRGHAAPDDWREPGILYISTLPDDNAPEAFAHQHERGLPVEEAPDVAGHRAFWLPEEGQVENRRLIEALRVACERSGVTIFENQRALPNQIPAEKVLWCAGAWSRAIGEASGVSVPVQPLAGEILALRAGELVNKVFYGNNCYLVPRRDGTLLIGATVEQRDFDVSTTDSARRKLLTAALEFVPELRRSEVIDHWAGLRPATPDGLPILGRTPQENMFVATGHGRNGILLTPVTAFLMAAHVLHNAPLPEAFSLERFKNQH